MSKSIVQEVQYTYIPIVEDQGEEESCEVWGRVGLEYPVKYEAP